MKKASICEGLDFSDKQKSRPSGRLFTLYLFFAALRWMSFTSSTMGMTLTAKQRATAYSAKSTGANSKAFARKGTSQTSVVAARLPRAAQLRFLFLLCRVKRLPR